MVFHDHIIELAASVGQAASPSAIPAPASDPRSRVSMERFTRRRLKLIKNILLLRRQSPNEARELITRIVSEVLRPVLERAWDGGGREMALKVRPFSFDRSVADEQVIDVVGPMIPPDLANSLRIGPILRRY